MSGSFTKLGYVALLAAAILFASVFRVFGNSNPTTLSACLTTGGTLINVTTGSPATCPAGSSPVSWGSGGGGLSQVMDVTSSQAFVVPAGVTHLGIEAWGGGGGGGNFNTSSCFAGGGGGSGGYLHTIIAVTPGESLAVVIGAGGAAGAPGAESSVSRGSTVLLSAGGGAGATTSGGAGGQVTSAGGIVRVGHAGGDGQPDPMCEFGFGNGTIFAPVGTGGTPVQGTVETLAGRSSGGSGANSGLTAQGGGSGEVVLSW